ncbi:MAG: SDR family NAD(P)-dependent oxidoreductase [Betaproteobacteria bacterium]|nr:SDR family NAD(P)-dependent oxidoreductase [Betaproteobacteria bacterium]
MSAQELQDKVAIVSGGGRGIGLAIVQAFVDAGAHVVVVDNGAGMDGDMPDFEAVAQTLRPLRDRVMCMDLDVAAADTAGLAVAQAVQRWGGVDILVNNAAILRDGFIFKSERANFERVIATNLTGAWALTAAATAQMRDGAKIGRPPGRIVNMISTAGLYGNFGQAAYASAKAALVGLTRVTAMDMARTRVHCNAVAPFAATRVTESIVPANDSQTQYKARALQVPPAYVARLVTWLASPACDISGQVLGVRGREVFLFSQPRPAARAVALPLVQQTSFALGEQLRADFAGQWTDLHTDLEAFNTDPVL